MYSVTLMEACRRKLDRRCPSGRGRTTVLRGQHAFRNQQVEYKYYTLDLEFVISLRGSYLNAISNNAHSSENTATRNDAYAETLSLSAKHSLVNAVRVQFWYEEFR